MTPEQPIGRRDARYDWTAEVTAVDVQTGVRLTGMVRNISRSGCYIATRNPFLNWTRVRIQILHDSERFEAEASVMHSRVGGMGVEFEKVAPRDQALLDSWLAKLSI